MSMVVLQVGLLLWVALIGYINVNEFFMEKVALY